MLGLATPRTLNLRYLRCRHPHMDPKTPHRERNQPLRRVWFLILLPRFSIPQTHLLSHRTICRWIK